MWPTPCMQWGGCWRPGQHQNAATWCALAAEGPSLETHVQHVLLLQVVKGKQELRQPPAKLGLLKRLLREVSCMHMRMRVSVRVCLNMHRKYKTQQSAGTRARPPSSCSPRTLRFCMRFAKSPIWQYPSTTFTVWWLCVQHSTKGCACVGGVQSGVGAEGSHLGASSTSLALVHQPHAPAAPPPPFTSKTKSPHAAFGPCPTGQVCTHSAGTHHDEGVGEPPHQGDLSDGGFPLP